MAIICAALFAVSLSGCLDSSLTFQIRFADLNGLQKGNRVVFEANHIGEVVQVNYTEKGDYLITVKIMPDFANATTGDSTFYIATDPAAAPAKAVIVEQSKPGGTIIQQGAVIAGTQKAGYLDELIRDLKEKAGTAETEFRKSFKEWEESFSSQSSELSKSLSETLEELSRQFEAIRDEVQNVPNREEVKELEKNIQEFVEDFNNAQRDVQEKLKNEIIPQLKLELEKLREQLKKEGREKELEKIDEEINGVIMI